MFTFCAPVKNRSSEYPAAVVSLLLLFIENSAKTLPHDLPRPFLFNMHASGAAHAMSKGGVAKQSAQCLDYFRNA